MSLKNYISIKNNINFIKYALHLYLLIKINKTNLSKIEKFEEMGKIYGKYNALIKAIINFSISNNLYLKIIYYLK